MKYFLKEERRLKLIDELIATSIPKPIAEIMANSQDNLPHVDAMMSAWTHQMMGYVNQLHSIRAGEDSEFPEEIVILFINADMTILDAYRDELVERNIGDDQVPMWNQAMTEQLAAARGNSKPN